MQCKLIMYVLCKTHNWTYFVISMHHALPSCLCKKEMNPDSDQTWFLLHHHSNGSASTLFIIAAVVFIFVGLYDKTIFD